VAKCSRRTCRRAHRSTRALGRQHLAAGATFDFAQAQRFDHVDTTAVLAPLQTDFIAHAQGVGKKSRTFEVDSGVFDDTRVSIEGVTE
jgi:hypothetical protein